MAHYYTEEDLRRERIRWNLSRLDDEDIQYCKREARKLYEMGLTDEDGKTISYDSWLDTVAEETVRMREHHRAMYCAEMYDD